MLIDSAIRLSYFVIDGLSKLIVRVQKPLLYFLLTFFQSLYNFIHRLVLGLLKCHSVLLHFLYFFAMIINFSLEALHYAFQMGEVDFEHVACVQFHVLLLRLVNTFLNAISNACLFAHILQLKFI